MRREYDDDTQEALVNKGSPLLAQGILALIIILIVALRITPACARSTHGVRHLLNVGEYLFCIFVYLFGTGSSQLARGVPDDITVPVTAEGIIPACAGSTPSSGACATPLRDHPSLRGEYASACMSSTFYTGSPQLARGVLQRLLTDARYQRIIPACAGSTLKKACIYVILVFYLSIFHLT